MTKQISEFTFDDRDEYNRRPIAANIVKLLVSDIKVSPLVIDGSWGSGKTEFCHKLINLLKTDNQEYEAIYIDAFRADHANEPLMTLLAGILEVLPDDVGESLLQKAIPAIRYGAKTLLKAGVGWVLRQDASIVVDNFDEEIKKASDDAINHTIESVLKDHVKANESIETLRNALAELASIKSIIIFVDELDRCRPDFAVSMLESIKHVFDVDGVQFVLITNTTQLKASINHCYGVGVDAQRYLDKFLGFSFILPQVFNVDNVMFHASKQHLQVSINNTALVELFEGQTGLIQFMKGLIQIKSLSLREVETFVKTMEIYQILTNEGGLSKQKVYGYKLLRVFGIFIFCFYPKLVTQIKNNEWNISSIAKVLGKEAGLIDLQNDNNFNNFNDFDVVFALIGFDGNINNEFFQEMEEELKGEWESFFEPYFRGSGCSPRRGNRIKIIDEVISRLELN